MPIAGLVEFCVCGCERMAVPKSQYATRGCRQRVYERKMRRAFGSRGGGKTRRRWSEVYAPSEGGASDPIGILVMHLELEAAYGL